MKKIIFFKGYYGFKNIGDDIFVLVAEYVTEKYLESMGLFIGNDLPKTPGESIKLSLGQRGICRLAEIISCFSANRIIVFGGSTISNIGGIKKLYTWIDRFRVLSKKTSTIGTSITVSREVHEQKRTIGFLRKLQMVAVRDRRSEMELMEKGVETVFSFDPAIIISDIFPELLQIEREKDVLGVCMCINNSESASDTIERTIDFLKCVVKDCDIKRVVVFRFFDSFEDKCLCEEIMQRCKTVVENVSFVDYTRDINKFCQEFVKCNMIFGSKLHAGIIAYSFKIPFMLDEYHKKCTDFLDTINHKYCYERTNRELSAARFKELWEKGKVPDIVEPSILKQVFYETILTYRDVYL